MASQVRIDLFSDAQWRDIWNRPPESPTIVQQIGRSEGMSPVIAIQMVAMFLGGNLNRRGFTVFRNAGTPMVKKCFEDFTFEIIFQLGKKPNPGVWLPLEAKLHVSHRGVARIRSLYTQGSYGSQCVVSANIGHLMLPPRHCLWNVAAVEEAGKEIAAFMDQYVLAYFEQFCEDMLAQDLLYRQVPLIQLEDSIELLLALGDKRNARRLYQDRAFETEQRRQEIEQRVKEICARGKTPRSSADIATRLAVIGYTHDLFHWC